ncbi:MULTISPECIES: T9SS type A sorting domain-containing protein [Segatella]|jgi:hypothetical protein|nr:MULTISPECIES: T9SS type A sorting domain-containing protein [Segatella]MEE3415423.1 T9SS type A sorting domain-containing protein [Prevotella sp.]MDR4930811.1 T9SS type A sorting domain-containing protein [Segatella bryantii]UKK73691.1 T9SS type A sorting domain-containing protein [Segatella bryantii]UKK76950.1 T9SS type A sorting domain-containing protein [Segatella bryantii]UKK78549.1 T9SS type A sorting domain-containing protein [Segatella baroniae B14]
MKNSILTIIVLIGMLVAPFVAESAQAAVAIEISDIDANDVTISVRGEILHVFNASGQVVHIYNLAGVCVGTYRVESNEKQFNLSNLTRGCYIIKVGKTVRKVSIS